VIASSIVTHQAQNEKEERKQEGGFAGVSTPL